MLFIIIDLVLQNGLAEELLLKPRTRLQINKETWNQSHRFIDFDTLFGILVTFALVFRYGILPVSTKRGCFDGQHDIPVKPIETRSFVLPIPNAHCLTLFCIVLSYIFGQPQFIVWIFTMVWDICCLFPKKKKRAVIHFISPKIELWNVLSKYKSFQFGEPLFKLSHLNFALLVTRQTRSSLLRNKKQF